MSAGVRECESAGGQADDPGPHLAPRTSHFRFPPALRLRTRDDFAGCYDAGVKRSRGPLLVFARPNGLGHPRLGTSVSRKVGNAVRRHAIKRRLREAFRLGQHDLPAGLDLLVVVRPHDPAAAVDYGGLLRSLASELEAAWSKRAARPSHADSPADSAPAPSSG